MKKIQPLPDDIAAILARYSISAQSKLLQIRELTHRCAGELGAEYCLVESVKWGEPAFRLIRPARLRARVGTTVRMDWKSATPDSVFVFFHCQTTLVDTFRTCFPNDFQFVGNRALAMPLAQPLPKDALHTCIESALIYYERSSA
jgi:hypothetical protein